ncbi:methyltransferase domain-containing protein [Sinorhizobium medicae]|nr:methyltransferase domain-containing protein [Sinorhizobium medicae]MDX0475193.1 methyltransferase domain-containing protein [Sinorhizobium medicae]
MPSEARARAARSLAELSVLVHALTSEVASLQEDTWQKLEVARGQELNSEIADFLCSLQNLLNDLSGAIREKSRSAAAQFQYLGKIGLHVGCRGDIIPDWINTDAECGDIQLNLLYELPFPNGAFELIYCSHTLEHFYYPSEVEFVLSELRRVLKPGGTIRIVVPDLEPLVGAYVAGDIAYFEARRKFAPIPYFAQTMLEDFLHYAGAGPAPGSGLQSHKFGFDFETLALLLKRCGFSSVVRSRYQGSNDPRLLVDTYSRSIARSGDMKHLSLFVEATT